MSERLEVSSGSLGPMGSPFLAFCILFFSCSIEPFGRAKRRKRRGRGRNTKVMSKNKVHNGSRRFPRTDEPPRNIFFITIEHGMCYLFSVLPLVSDTPITILWLPFFLLNTLPNFSAFLAFKT